MRARSLRRTPEFFKQRRLRAASLVRQAEGMGVPSIADVRDAVVSRAGAFGRSQSLTHLAKTVRERLNAPAILHVDLEKESTPEERRNALTYGSICGRAYARRWGKFYGLFNKY